VIDRRGCWTRTAWPFILLGLGSGLAGVPSTAIGQDARVKLPTAAVEQIVARLKSVCESDGALRGARVQRGELKDGTLSLTGTIDRAGQVGLIEAEAQRLLDASPSWKAQVPGGVSAAKLIFFPVRGALLPRLRSDLVRGNTDPKARPVLLQQTRIDDLYFDVHGRLRAMGLCINQGAYVAHKNAAPDQDNDPLTPIAKGIHDRLRDYPLPDGVDPKILDNFQADQIVFEENPARRLQRWANESKLDNVLFRDARFDGDGALMLDGLLGEEAERAQVAALLSRPEFVRLYARPGGVSPTEPGAAVGPMIVVPWRKSLLADLQQRFARDVNRNTPRADLRYCRVDRAQFTYPEKAGLLLRFEGVALRAGDDVSNRIATGLSNESHRLFAPPIRVDYNVKEDLIKLPNPVRKLQEKVAAAPALDGVRLDDLTFGPTGQPTFEGLWMGPAQAAALEAVLLPELAEQTKGKVSGPLTWRLNEFPADRLLRDLRGKAAAAFEKTSETSLDRLFFQPAADPGRVPGLVLQGATIATRLDEVKAGLMSWLQENELIHKLGNPEVKLAAHPRSLVVEVRKLVTAEPDLDGLRVVQGVFDDENVFVLSGEQDHEGQAERVVALARAAAATAWPDLPPPTDIRAGAFAIHPLRPLLDNLNRKLPNYPQADREVLVRSYYDADNAIVLAGRTTNPGGDHQALKELIKLLIHADPKSEIKLVLTPQPIDLEAADRAVRRGIDALAGGTIASFGHDALDRAILFNPSSSTAWYLRAAYYHVVGNHELAERDLRRVRILERRSGASAERNRALERFQGPLRQTLEEMLANVSNSPE
jgi:hypothetical protein